MIRAERCHYSQVKHLLAAILSPKTDAYGTVDMAALAARGMVFRVMDGETAVAAIVLEPLGPLLWGTALGGRADFDLTRVAALLTEQLGREFDEIGFRTERPGLVRKALKLGYRIHRQAHHEYFMRKTLR